MFRTTNFDSLLQLDRFTFDRDEIDFFDDFSKSSEDSYDSLTTKESLSSDSSVSSNEPKRKRYKTGPVIKTKEDMEKVSQWQHQQYLINNVPKIFKTDIRRSYSNIFTNVINSLEFPLMFEFLKSYCVPEFIHMQTCGSQQVPKVGEPVDACAGAKFARLVGLQPVAQFWFNKFQLMSDAVYQLTDTKVHTYSNTDSSKIVSRFSVSGTRVFDIPFQKMFPPQLQLKPDVEEKVKVKGSKKRSFNEESKAASEILISDEIISLMTPENMLPEPEVLNLNLQLVMHLDNNKHIEKFEFEML